MVAVNPRINNMKTCCCCKQLKNLTEFYNANTRKDKTQGRCKDCQNYRARELRALKKKPKLINLSVKSCSKCHEEKPLTEFIKSKASTDGRRPECKSCSIKTNNPVRRNRLLQKNFGIDIII